jgi:hypothetical protein
MNMKDVFNQLGQYDTRTLLRAKQGQSLEAQEVYIQRSPRATIWDCMDEKTRKRIIGFTHERR